MPSCTLCNHPLDGSPGRELGQAVLYLHGDIANWVCTLCDDELWDLRTAEHDSEWA